MLGVNSLIILFFAFNLFAHATDYHVGPGQTRANISEVPWDALQAGDRIYIHWRSTPYFEKWVINGQGTAQDRSLPVRGLKDAGLEREFKNLARSSVPSQFQIVDVIITSSSWGVNKDALGRPLNRAMIAYMVEKDSAGKCYVQYFAFSQPAMGGSYGKTQVDLDWSSKTRREVDCQ